MTDRQLGPWPLGIDQISDDADMPEDNTGRVVALRDCQNFDLTREGWPDVRPGHTIVSAAVAHSLWARSETSPVYGGVGTDLVRVDRTGPTAVSVTVLANLPSAAPLDFDDLNGEVVFSSADYLGVIGAGDVVRPLCVADAGAPAVAVSSAGGMFPGRYAVAAAWVNAAGVEGGLSPASFLDVPQGGGISLSMPPPPDGAAFLRVYRTPNNSRILYRAADVPVALPTYLLGRDRLGRRAGFQYKRAMRPGAIVRYWKGRLLTAVGNLLTISEPLAYHLHDPRHGVVPFPREIAFVEGVEGGVYVGLVDDTVMWLRGTDERTWEYATTGGNPPFARSSMTTSDSLFSPDLQVKGIVAVWLAQNGFVIGRPDGTLAEPQARRIALSVTTSGRTTAFNRRLLTIVNP